VDLSPDMKLPSLARRPLANKAWTSSALASLVPVCSVIHGLITVTIKTQSPKCRLFWCIIEFIDWIQSCWYFRPSYVNYCPSNLLSCSPPPPLPTSKYRICTKSVWLEGGGGGAMLSCVGDHIPQEFNTIYLTRFRTYKTALPLSNKN
jgi:hypothetical protein